MLSLGSPEPVCPIGRGCPTTHKRRESQTDQETRAFYISIFSAIFLRENSFLLFGF